MEKLHSVVHFRIDFKYLTVRNEREREREREKRVWRKQMEEGTDEQVVRTSLLTSS